MKDSYPDYPALPAEWLVPRDDQPEFLPLPGQELDEGSNLGAELSDALVARGHGDSTAIVHHESGRTLTYRQLTHQSDCAASALAELGVRPGDRVGLRGPNHPDLLVAAIGAWKLGAVVVPIPLQARESELRHFLADTEPAVLVTNAAPAVLDPVIEATGDDRGCLVIVFGSPHRDYPSWDRLLVNAPTPLPARHVPLDSVAIVWHTGGTTGKPKGCYHTQRRFLLAGHSIGRATGAAPGQVWAASTPIGHALGFIYHTIYTLLHGATIVLIEELANPVTVLEAIDRHRVDTFTAITATWARMLEVIQSGGTTPPRSLRRGFAMWQSSSAAEVYDGWRAHGIELINNFGSTAFATWVLVPNVSNAVPRASLGRPAPGYDVRAIEPGDNPERMIPGGATGRMAVRGPTGLTYWRLPEMQRRDVRAGWTLVDDLIRFDSEGNAHYLGRTDFLISTAGHKVAPGEVENVLAAHPAVREVAVVGLPDPVRREVVAAFVVVADPWESGEDLRTELQHLVKTELAPYKYPRVVRFLPQLPRDHLGKVQPRVLIEHDTHQAAEVSR